VRFDRILEWISANFAYYRNPETNRMHERGEESFKERFTKSQHELSTYNIYQNADQRVKETLTKPCEPKFDLVVKENKRLVKPREETITELDKNSINKSILKNRIMKYLENGVPDLLRTQKTPRKKEIGAMND
jgi:hypothetical protein